MADSGQPSDHAKPPDWYMGRAVESMRRVQEMTSGSVNSSKVKPNRSQCKYLAQELETAVEGSREAYTRSSSHEHKAECLEALKLLFRLAKEVESFIRDCCKEEAWVQASLTSSSVAVRVSSWGYYLKLCTEILRISNKLGGAWVTFNNLERNGVVETMASDDKEALLAAWDSLTNEPESADSVRHLAPFLLERLKATGSWSRLRKVDAAQFLKVQALGRGTAATVHKATWNGSFEVAEKVFPTPSHRDLVEEVVRLEQLSHPNIVSFLGYRDDEQSISMFMELMDGDLRLMAQQRMQEDSARLTPFSISVACDIMFQVAEGVNYMHQRGFVHGNLKPTSILVKGSKDANDEYISAKVANFGLFKTKGKCVDRNAVWMEYATPRWMAQELLPTGQYGHDYREFTKHVESATFMSDAYSFAMLCVEILTGNIAFSDIEDLGEVRKEVLKGHRPKLTSKCPSDLKDLITLCWDPVPTLRPNFSRICAELRYIKCSLLLESTVGQDDDKHSPVQPFSKALDLPGKVSRFKGNYSSLKLVRQLGKGGSDSVIVYLATWHRTEGVQEIAQKQFFGSHDQGFVNEVSIMADLEHPNVARLLFYASDRRSCSIVMELMDEDLHDLMRRRRLEENETPTGPFPLDDAIHVILQIALGMEYVHGKNVVHRDLKSCNILVRNPIGEKQLEVKVADFGLSKKLASQRSALLGEDAGVGTVRWMAPEVMGFETSSLSKYDPFKSDVYSFGMVCYEVLTGRVPFCEMQNLSQVKEEVLVRNVRPILPKWEPLTLKDFTEKCLQALKGLIEKCWQREASRRPSFSEIVKEMVAIIEDCTGRLAIIIEGSPKIIQELATTTKELPKIIEELARIIKRSQKDIEELTKRIEKLSESITDLRHLTDTIKTWTQTTITLQSFTQTISKQEDLIGMQGKLAEKEEDLVEANADLNEKKDELKKKQDELTSKQKKLTREQEKLTSKEQELAASKRLKFDDLTNIFIGKWRQIPI